jgi:hypothetical protein
MTTQVNSGPPATSNTRIGGGPRLDRIVVGLLLGAVGVGWLLDQAGVSVAWRMFPAVALILIGFALIGTLLGGRGRGALIVLGVIALIVGVAVGVGADRYSGPAGDRMVAPTAAEWPVHQQVSAGTVTVDLTRHPLPETGRLEVDVGAGRIQLVLPERGTVGVDVTVTAGNITVDGVQIRDGIDLQWSSPAQRSSPVDVVLHVGLGQVEVDHG